MKDRTTTQIIAQTLSHAPGGRFLVNMRIAGKLTLGFGIVVLLTLIVVGLSFLSSRQASSKIDTTSELRAPLALASSKAQADLLTMLSDVRGYLALGDNEYRTGYEGASTAFEADLVELERLLGQENAATPELRARLDELQTTFNVWSELPDQLFDLRDDQLQREPALRILLQDASPQIASILVATDALIKSKEQQEPTTASIEAVADLAQFQSSFLNMVAGLRGYVTTGRSSFKFEYESNLDINQEAWDNLTSDNTRFNLTQLEQLRTIGVNRNDFLEISPEMFEAVEGERAREDLYLFRTEAVPLAEQMLQLLNEITLDQQNLLQADLNQGNDQLVSAQQRNLAIGLVAVLVAVVLSFMIQRSIVGPIERLTAVANDIGQGKLTARAAVEANDEIGTLATTFNAMTGQLSDTLDDLELRRREQAAIAEKLQRQNQYFAALHQTALGMIGRLDLNDLLEDLMTRVVQLLNTSHGFVYLTDTETAGKLELKIGKGIFQREVGLIVKAGEGLGGQVWQSGEPAIIEDYDTWEGRIQSFEYKLLGKTVAVPLIRPTSEYVPRTDPIGVIGVAYDPGGDHDFGDDELELLARFSDLASIAIDNARLYTAAQEARAAAEAADQSKSDFLNSVSHELRTPLTSILGFTRLIQKRLDSRIIPLVEDADRRTKRAVHSSAEEVAIILQEGERLTTLINNVLDLAKIEAGKIEWYMEELALHDVVNRAIAATSALFENSQLQLKTDIHPAPIIEGDRDKLIQVAINLISNAVKFTDEGSVTCRVRHENDEVIVSVIDTGTGIAPEDHPKVFEKFRQVGDTLTEKPKGTGLGLPICREIVEHHGGRIWVESELGSGSTFSFAIPILQAQESETAETQ